MVDAKAKAAREAEARRALLGNKTREQAIAEFIARGNPDATPDAEPQPIVAASAPAQTIAETVELEEAGSGNTTTAVDEASEGPESASAAEEPIPSPAKPVKPAKKAPAATPWESAHPRVTINFSTKFPEELHMQMTWLTNNVPKLSIQKIVQEGVAHHVAKLLKEHYKQ